MAHIGVSVNKKNGEYTLTGGGCRRGYRGRLQDAGTKFKKAVDWEAATAYSEEWSGSRGADGRPRGPGHRMVPADRGPDDPALCRATTPATRCAQRGRNEHFTRRGFHRTGCGVASCRASRDKDRRATRRPVELRDIPYRLIRTWWP